MTRRSSSEPTGDQNDRRQQDRFDHRRQSRHRPRTRRRSAPPWSKARICRNAWRNIARGRRTRDAVDAGRDQHAQIQQAVERVGALDVLINNAGVAIYDDPGNLDTIEQHLAVNLFGIVKVTRAFLPLLKRSNGAIVNNLSLAALAPLPMIPGYSMSKAAALNMTQSLRARLARQGVSVHAVILGPIDTDMNRGFDIPKAAPAIAAKGIFDGLQKGEEEIFPDPASQSIAEGWRAGTAKALERQFEAFVPSTAPGVAAVA